MAIAFVQSKAANSASTGTTLGATYTGACTNPSRLIAVGYFNSSSMTATFSDGTNAWTNIGSPLRGVGSLSAFSIQVGSVANTSTSALTVTMTTSGTTTNKGIAIHEITGAVGGLDVFSYANVTGTGTLLSPSVAASTATSRYWFAVAVLAGASTSSVGGGFTQRELANFADNYTADEIISTLTAQQASFGVVANNAAMSFLGAFSATAAAPSVVFLT